MIQIKKILVPTDFSSNSKKALVYAIELARAFGAEVILAHVMEPPIMPAVPLGMGTASVASIQDETRKYLREQLDRLFADELEGKVPGRTLLREGKAFFEIIQAAREESADLIVIATHGYSGLQHVLMGSTAEKVVRKSPCPVLSVRDGEHEFVMP